MMNLTKKELIDKCRSLDRRMSSSQEVSISRKQPGVRVVALASVFLFSVFLVDSKKMNVGWIVEDLTIAELATIDESVRISAYDEIIHKHARENSVDWRLISSIIYVESAFRERARSRAGARGLMQIMPVVAREQGVTLAKAYQPEYNIRAGVNHFTSRMRLINGDSHEDVLKLSLAAYNAGLGHLRDAQRLAIRMNKNPRRWNDVRPMLLLLQKRQYFKFARYGYCRGSETVHYVKKVTGRYAFYRSTYPYQPVHLTQVAQNNSTPQT